MIGSATRPWSARRATATALAVAALTSGLAVLPPAVAPASADDPIGGPRLAGEDTVIDPGPGAADLPEIAAAAWLLADAATGEILATKAPHLQRRPASTLKTLTALTLIPQLEPDAVYTAVRQDVTAEGSRVGLVEGSDYTVHDLFLALFLPSANDAASALANANGGWEKTLREMNAMADSLQALDTEAKTPSGLDAPGQTTSAYDLALIARAGLRNPQFAAYCRTLRASFPGANARQGQERSSMTIYTQNRLLSNGFEGAIGVKTGYTTEAGRTFVGAATRDGRTLIATFLGITESTETAATDLLEWGFANADDLAPVGVLVDPVVERPASPSASPSAPVAAGPPPAEAPIEGTAVATVALSVTGISIGVLLLIAALLRMRVRRRQVTRRRVRHFD